MKEQRDRSFWVEVLKWFLIWNFLSLLFKGFMSVCKGIIREMEQIIHHTTIGIKELIPVVKDKAEQLKLDYTQKHKPKMDNKVSQVKQLFSKMKNQKLRPEFDFLLILKKAKYWIIDFFYTYEFQILIIGILGIVIAINFVILNKTVK